MKGWPPLHKRRRESLTPGPIDEGLHAVAKWLERAGERLDELGYQVWRWRYDRKYGVPARCRCRGYFDGDWCPSAAEKDGLCERCWHDGWHDGERSCKDVREAERT